MGDYITSRYACALLIINVLLEYSSRMCSLEIHSICLLVSWVGHTRWLDKVASLGTRLNKVASHLHWSKLGWVWPHEIGTCRNTIALFPGLPPPSSFCMLQVIKNWMVGRPGNEARNTMHSLSFFYAMYHVYMYHCVHVPFTSHDVT